MSEEDKPLSMRARRKYKAEHEKYEREKHVAEFHRRMELARKGAMAFKDSNFKDAIQNYYSYLEILEKSKNVKAGGLDLKHFDQKKDIAELLLLTGVYWDLSKLHDKFAKKDTTKLDRYIDRFVAFSKGLPYQHLSSELVRKYLVNGNPRNRKNFKDAHIRLGGGKCFIATSVEEYCAIDTLPALRNFRDQTLMKSILGRTFVRVYYRVGPFMARVVLRTSVSFQQRLARFFDSIVKKLP